ncbi:hypothetical protein J2W39_004998 [Variovorax paradoxus]|uniref:Uncharacterized protein n=1 Tax=Variovorax paradoxus TaxID=34073 RepID=A0AAW8EMV1_VARPD|nr:hypothetical protein [Variovorax paradoxus]MDP9973735.1 hypothetical protein [Variovorax paradoxus]
MRRGRTDTNWPNGMLRACESVESIAAKLAIFNRVDVLAYVPEVLGCSPSALSRLLREPLHRVRVATERPAWVGEMDALIKRSAIRWESEWDAKNMALRRKYCTQCLESFYHSWIHDLSWMDYCFVHRRTKLAVISPVYQVPEAHSLVKKLHTTWNPALESHIRSPEASLPLFARLSNRRLLHALKALGAQFEPTPSSEVSHGAFTCHPVAMNSWWEAIEQRDGAAAVPWKGTLEVEQADGERQESVADASPGDVQEEQPAREDAVLEQNEPSAPGYARAEVGIITDVRAHTRAALACALVSAIRKSTNNWLTQHHEKYRQLHFAGETRFAPYSASPNFRAQLAHVLATGSRGRERLLLKEFIARLSHGHERCLEKLHRCYDRWDHLAMVENSPMDSDYIAYHLREHGVCPRLVTLDLVTRLLRPHFLCADRRMDVLERRASPGRDVWQHAALRTQGLFGSHEWHAYKWAYKSTLVFPHSVEVEHLSHILRALEWAFWRRESRGHGPKPIDVVLNEIVFDQQLVMVRAEEVDKDFRGGELLCTYFSPDGVDPPAWDALTVGDSLHVRRTLRVLDEIRTSDLPSRWIDLLD